MSFILFMLCISYFALVDVIKSVIAQEFTSDRCCLETLKVPQLQFLFLLLF